MLDRSTWLGRRDFLRFIVGGTAIVVMADMEEGCGGGGHAGGGSPVGGSSSGVPPADEAENYRVVDLGTQVAWDARANDRGDAIWGFRYSRDGQQTELTFRPASINNHGVAVGLYARLFDGSSTSDLNDRLSPEERKDVYFSSCEGINDSDQIAVTSEYRGRSCLYRVTGTRYDRLDPRGVSYARAQAISATGRILGYFTLRDDLTYYETDVGPFTWAPEEGLALYYKNSFTSDIHPVAINSSGTVVGSVGATPAVIRPLGEFTPLDHASLDGRAEYIYDKGHIVGNLEEGVSKAPNFAPCSLGGTRRHLFFRH